MRIPLLALFLSLLFLKNEALATHCAGGSISYEWIADSSYRVFFKFYRDCTGINVAPTTDLCVTNSCSTSLNKVVHMTLWTGTLPDGRANGSPIDAGCGQYPTKCALATSIIPGYQEYWYSTVVHLPIKCNSWRFSVSIAERNPSDNTMGVSGGKMYIETKLNNVLFEGNSSPTFTIQPPPYLCANAPFSYGNGVVDADGDSIVFDMVQPQNNPCGETSPAYVNMSPGITFPANPLPCNNTFTLDPHSGQFSFSPAVQGVYTLTTRVREYRKGLFIGQTLRDVQLQVMSCSPDPVNTAVDEKTLVNARLVNNVISTFCGSTSLAFCFDVVSTSKTAVLKITDNHTQATPGATVTYSNIGADSVRGCFAWNLSSKDTAGERTFVIFIKDSTCNPPGLAFSQSYSFQIRIVSLFKPPPVDVILPAGRDTVCQYDSISVLNIDTAYENYSNVRFSWDGGQGLTWAGTNPYRLSWETHGLKQAVLLADDGVCIGADTLAIFVKESPEAFFEIKKDVCAGQTVGLKPVQNTQALYHWLIDEVHISDLGFKPEHQISWKIPGRKTVSLKIQAINDCKSKYYTDTVDVHMPKVAILGINKVKHCLADTISIVASGGGVTKYEWSPQENYLDIKDSFASYVCARDGYISLKSTDQWGCSSTESVQLKIDPCCKIFVPDGFTPNGDGNNDAFRIVTNGNIYVQSFLVKNRWGQTVFETGSRDGEWDGVFNGKQQDPGVYFYYLKYTCGDKKSESFRQGIVLLVR